MSQRAVVYEDDDRQDYFELADDSVKARLSSSLVALIPRSALERSAAGVRLKARAWSEAANLCPDARFAQQPAAAFCSGVLVDWDLVLTSGHCTRVLPTDEFVVAFGYYLQDPGTVTFAEGDLLEVADVVAEALDQTGQTPRLDYAWLRLQTTPRPPRAPAPVVRSWQGIKIGDQLVALSAIGGTPIKADVGGAISDLRAPTFDYFVANTDTAEGSSGGGAFDRGSSLLGILARGGNDYAGAEGRSCVVHAVQPASRAPEEEFTYASAAVQALCTKDPGVSSLCRDDCGDPCVSLPPGGGCAFGPARHNSGLSTFAGLVALVLLGVRRRWRRHATVRSARLNHCKAGGSDSGGYRSTCVSCPAGA